METVKKWVISDLSGKNIFFFSLYRIDNSKCLYFDTNLCFPSNDKKIIDLLEMVVSGHLVDSLIDFIAEQLFNTIKSNKFYEQFYFSDTVLDKNGRLNMSSYKINQEIELKKLNDSDNYYVPYSNYSIPELFTAFSNFYAIHLKEIMANSVRVPNLVFEIELKNTWLREQYVNIYHQDNLFYIHKAENGDNTYFITNNYCLVFAFKTP